MGNRTGFLDLQDRLRLHPTRFRGRSRLGQDRHKMLVGACRWMAPPPPLVDSSPPSLAPMQLQKRLRHLCLPAQIPMSVIRDCWHDAYLKHICLCSLTMTDEREFLDSTPVLHLQSDESKVLAGMC